MKDESYVVNHGLTMTFNEFFVILQEGKSDTHMLTAANLSKSRSSEKVFSEDDSSMEQPVWEDDGLPPSYDSIFNQLKDAKESPENAIGFFKKAMQTFAGTSES